MPKLTGRQIGEFRDLLVARFPSPSEFRQLIRTHLDQNLDAIVGVEGQPLTAVAFALIEWTEARGRTGDLLGGVRDERAGVPEVVEVCDRLLAHVGASAAADAASPTQVNAGVIEFRTILGERRVAFRSLNAYKALHDVLHKLQDMQEGITQAADRFARGTGQAVEVQVIADALGDDLVGEANDARQNLEFPEDVPEWIGTFGRTVEALRASLDPPDLPALAAAVETLRTLPNQQAGMNKELVRCARRIRADALADMLDGITTGLGATPGVTDLAGRITAFRALCRRLAGLIIDHDACQGVDTALMTVGPGPVGRDKVYRWPDVLAALLRIAGRRPADTAADRLAEYARAFDAAKDEAAAAAKFTLLRGQFVRLFSRTDQDLLKVTDQLVGEAGILEARLGAWPTPPVPAGS